MHGRFTRTYLTKMMSGSYYPKMNCSLISLVLLCLSCALSSAIASPLTPISLGFRSALASRTKSCNEFQNSKQRYRRHFVDDEQFVSAVMRGGATKEVSKPHGFLKLAYSLCGVASTAAWSTCVYTAIRPNQPPGALMPSSMHKPFARLGAISTVPLIVASYKALVSSCNDWEELSSPACRRQNLALATANAGSALWVKYAHIITRIPGTDPLVGHIGYSGPSALPRAALIAAYGSAAAFSAAVWVRSLPEDDRKNPLSWPGRVVDGVAQSLVSFAPKSSTDPVNVKYSILASGFLFFTGLQLVGQHPVSGVFSWTARRLPRAFPAWTLLASTTAYNLKEATENGTLLTESKYRDLSYGIRGFGTLYLAGKAGSVFLDPSWPDHFKLPTAVPGWAMAAIMFMSYTLRSDTP